MKFLFHAPSYKPAYGGPLHTVSGLAEGLVRRGHEVFVAAGNRNLSELLDVDPEKIYERDGVRVRYFATGLNYLQQLGIPYFSQSAMFQFGDSLKQWLAASAGQFDILHTHMAFLGSSSVFSQTAKRLHKTYFYHQHGNLDPVRLKFRAWKKRMYLQSIEKPVMHRADILMALTEYERSSYQALGLTNRIEIVPNGISADYATLPHGDISPHLVTLFKHIGDAPLFLFLSRIHPLKGPQHFVEAFIHFARHNPQGIAIMAGPDEFGWVRTFQTQIHAAGLQERFHLVGPVIGNDKMALLQRADVFVLPTYSEGFSIALLEALICGCAVITTPGAHFDEIEPAGAGLIVDASTSGILDGMIGLSQRGRTVMNEMGKKGRELILEKSTWPPIIDRYESLASELSGGRENNAKAPRA